MINYIHNYIVRLTSKESDNLLTNGIQLELSKESVFLDSGDYASRRAFAKTGFDLHTNTKTVYIGKQTWKPHFINPISFVHILDLSIIALCYFLLKEAIFKDSLPIRVT